VKEAAGKEGSRALAARRLETDAARAAAVAPAVRSLLERLLRLRDALPTGAEPPPTRLERPRP
jgi:hypothetical protein